MECTILVQKWSRIFICKQKHWNSVSIAEIHHDIFQYISSFTLFGSYFRMQQKVMFYLFSPLHLIRENCFLCSSNAYNLNKSVWSFARFFWVFFIDISTFIDIAIFSYKTTMLYVYTLYINSVPGRLFTFCVQTKTEKGDKVTKLHIQIHP